MLPTTDSTGRPRPAPASLWQPSPELLADLEAAYAALPPPSSDSLRLKGAAGRKLQARCVSTIPADLLEDFARTKLGTQRLNANYLAALRVVLGNQAQAEREGLDLELNHRVPFASERTMRTIIDQMRDAGITKGKTVILGEGKRQCIQCFRGNRESAHSWADATKELEWRYRRREGESPYDADLPSGLRHDDVPEWPRSLTSQ